MMKFSKMFGGALVGAAALLTAGLMPDASHIEAGSPVPAQTGSDYNDLQSCINEQRSLSVLFLVDTSLSLRQIDPDAARVPALQSALQALDSLRRADSLENEVSIFVDFLDFSTTARRSFPQTPQWQRLPSDISRMANQMAEFAERNGGQDTDYVGALEPWNNRRSPSRPADEIGAIELLERAPSGSCQLLVWFTDGAMEFDFRGQAKSFNWAREEIILSSREGQFAVMRAATDALCASGGVVDRLRLNQTGRSSAPFVAVVALERAGRPQNFSLIESIATGASSSGERCGNREANGSFLTTSELPQLVSQLRRSVLGRPGAEDGGVATCLASEVGKGQEIRCEFPFFISESFTRFNLLTTSTGRGVDVALIDPSGARTPLVDRGTLTNSVGAVLEMSRPLPEVFLVDASLPSGSSSWAGQWKVLYSTTDPVLARQIRNSVEIHVFGALEAALRPGTVLFRGRESRFRIELRSADGSPRGPLAFSDESRIVVVAGGEELAQPPISEDGSFEYRIQVPDDEEITELPLRVQVFPRFRINSASEPIELKPWTGDIGPLRVSAPPRYPLVELRSDFSVLNVENPTARAVIVVDSTSPESGGCVAFGGSQMEYPQAMASFVGLPTFEVYDGGRLISLNEPCAIPVDDGETRELELRITFDPEQLRITTSQVRGLLEFSSTSARDPLQAEILELVAVAPVRPIYSVTVDTGRAIGLMAAAILLPMMLMYAVSIFYSSRFQLPESAMRVQIPVLVKNGRIYRDVDGRETPATIRDDDLSLTGLQGKWARKVDLGNFSFSIRPSLSPVGQPVASVTSRAADLVVSRYGSRRGKGDPGGNLSNVWAMALSRSDFASAALGEDGEVNPQGQIGAVRAEFLALVPSGPGASRAFAEVVSDVEQHALADLEGEAVRLAAAQRKSAEIREAKTAPKLGKNVDSGSEAGNQPTVQDRLDALPGDTQPLYADSTAGSVSIGPKRPAMKKLIDRFKRTSRTEEPVTFIEDDLPT